jgi:hypothetical protein
MAAAEGDAATRVPLHPSGARCELPRHHQHGLLQGLLPDLALKQRFDTRPWTTVWSEGEHMSLKTNGVVLQQAFVDLDPSCHRHIDLFVPFRAPRDGLANRADTHPLTAKVDAETLWTALEAELGGSSADTRHAAFPVMLTELQVREYSTQGLGCPVALDVVSQVPGNDRSWCPEMKEACSDGHLATRSAVVLHRNGQSHEACTVFMLDPRACNRLTDRVLPTFDMEAIRNEFNRCQCTDNVLRVPVVAKPDRLPQHLWLLCHVLGDVAANPDNLDQVVDRSDPSLHHMLVPRAPLMDRLTELETLAAQPKRCLWRQSGLTLTLSPLGVHGKWEAAGGAFSVWVKLRIGFVPVPCALKADQ